MNASMLAEANKKDDITVLNDLHAEPEVTKTVELETSLKNDEPLSSSLKVYVNEMGGLKLLSREAENKLAKLIHDTKAEIKAIETKISVTQSGIKELITEIRELETDLSQSRKLLADANLRVVFAVAHNHLNKGLAFTDLINEGTRGLMKAVDSYEASQGVDFSTYAIFWIRLAIARAIVEHEKQAALIEIASFNGKMH